MATEGFVVQKLHLPERSSLFQLALTQSRRFIAAAGDCFVGQSFALIVIYLVLMPWILGGAIRAATGASLLAGLAIATVLTGICAALAIPPMLRSEREQWSKGAVTGSWSLFLQVVPVALAAVAVARLFNKDFSGFPNIDGWDGGSHLFLQQTFVHSQSNLYNGFVGQYVVCQGLQWLLHFDPFRAVATTFYAAVAVSIGLPVCLLIDLTRTARTASIVAKLASIAVGASALFFLADASFLPLLHYLQGMGYYPQAFGLVSVALIWFFDVTLTKPIARVFGLLLALVLTRYTYGLNLPDLLGALGLVSLIDSRRRPGIGWGKLTAAGLFAASAIGYAKLEPIFEIWGGIARNNVNMSLATTVCVGLLVAATAFSSTPANVSAEDDGNSTLWRAVRFPLASMAVTAMSFTYFEATAKQVYYLQKYQLLSVWFVASAAALAAGHIVLEARHIVAGPRVFKPTVSKLIHTMSAAALIGCALLAGSHFWRLSFVNYRPAYRERIGTAIPPYAHLRPLVDRRATRLIRETLERTGSNFGGYLTGNFPMFSFMNGYFGYHTGNQDFFAPKMEPGHCVFWVAPQDDVFPLGNQTMVNAWKQKLGEGPNVHCDRYSVRWKATGQSLCQKCF
jgi:hypothetical protein